MVPDTGDRSPRVLVGECPEHGYVFGDDVVNNFPNPATCGREDCGEEIELATMADKKEVKRRAE